MCTCARLHAASTANTRSAIDDTISGVPPRVRWRRRRRHYHTILRCARVDSFTRTYITRARYSSTVVYKYNIYFVYHDDVIAYKKCPKIFVFTIRYDEGEKKP